MSFSQVRSCLALYTCACRCTFLIKGLSILLKEHFKPAFGVCLNYSTLQLGNANMFSFPSFRDHPVISALWVLLETPDCPDPRLLQVACPRAHPSASTLASRLVHHSAVMAARRDLTSWNKNNDNINNYSYFYTPVPTSDSSFYHTAERIILSDTLPKSLSSPIELRISILSLFLLYIHSEISARLVFCCFAFEIKTVVSF